MTTQTILITIVAVISLIIGIIIGGILNSLKIGEIYAGDFVITYGDPEKNLVGIDLSVDLPAIEAAKYISLKVQVNGDPNSILENSRVEES